MGLENAIRCLIVDDNDMARLTLRELVSRADSLLIDGECRDAMEAHRQISKSPPDLVFLDIEMPGMNGIELLRSLPKKPLIIFTTSKKDYAVEAFELNVVDYLIKPVTMPRLLQAVEKAREIIDRNNSEVKQADGDHLFIRDNGVLKKIKLDDILWIEAMGDYIKIYTPGKWHIVHTTLKAVEEKINSQQLMRIHRSYIVALNKIDSIEDNVLNIMNTPIPVAESYRSQLMQRLKLL
jgi:DNA-binding LytR/AlgR family response regulator